MGIPSSTFQPFRRTFNRRGSGQCRKPGEMNAVEAKYHARLDAMYRAGQIAWFGFETVTFKLSQKTPSSPGVRYTPDFMVMLNSGDIQFHEVKGGKKKKRPNGEDTGERTYWCEEAAKKTIRIAAEMFPFRFSIVYPKLAGEWGRQDFWSDEATPTHEAEDSGEDELFATALRTPGAIIEVTPLEGT